MGGERETTVKHNNKAGSARAGDIRIHESGGAVHLHDDVQKLKVEVPSAIFFTAWQKIKNNIPHVSSSVETLYDASHQATATLRLRPDSDLEITITKSDVARPNFTSVDKFVTGR